jgi:hypothetical protein
MMILIHEIDSVYWSVALIIAFGVSSVTLTVMAIGARPP